MNRVVLDASAILAAIGNETGADVVLEHIEHAAVSTVNVAEVTGKLMERGFPSADALEAALSFSREVFDFDTRQANLVGELLLSTRPKGLSLGDRACLALGIILKAPVYTADKVWLELNLGVDVQVVR